MSRELSFTLLSSFSSKISFHIPPHSSSPEYSVCTVLWSKTFSLPTFAALKVLSDAMLLPHSGCFKTKSNQFTLSPPWLPLHCLLQRGRTHRLRARALCHDWATHWWDNAHCFTWGIQLRYCDCTHSDKSGVCCLGNLVYTYVLTHTKLITMVAEGQAVLAYTNISLQQFSQGWWNSVWVAVGYTVFLVSELSVNILYTREYSPHDLYRAMSWPEHVTSSRAIPRAVTAMTSLIAVI